MLIPEDRLSPDAFNGLVEEFIHREGTDYGHHEVDLDRKVADIKAQVSKGNVVIVFDPATESINLMTKEQYKQWLLESSANTEGEYFDE